MIAADIRFRRRIQRENTKAIRMNEIKKPPSKVLRRRCVGNRCEAGDAEEAPMSWKRLPQTDRVISAVLAAFGPGQTSEPPRGSKVGDQSGTRTHAHSPTIRPLPGKPRRWCCPPARIAEHAAHVANWRSRFLRPSCGLLPSLGSRSVCRTRPPAEPVSFQTKHARRQPEQTS